MRQLDKKRTKGRVVCAVLSEKDSGKVAAGLVVNKIGIIFRA